MEKYKTEFKLKVVKSFLAGDIYDDGEWMCGDCFDRYSTY